MNVEETWKAIRADTNQSFSVLVSANRNQWKVLRETRSREIKISNIEQGIMNVEGTWKAIRANTNHGRSNDKLDTYIELPVMKE